MTTTIQIDLKAARSLLPMTLSLTQIIRRLLLKNLPPIVSNGVTINFRDPSYSADAGGFHPVEIRLEYALATSMWQVCYITDFATKDATSLNSKRISTSTSQRVQGIRLMLDFTR